MQQNIVDKKVLSLLGSEVAEYVPIFDLTTTQSAVSHDGIVCENGTAAWLISNGAYMTGLLNLTKAQDFGVEFLQEISGTNLLPCRRKHDGSWEFFLTVGRPFGAFGHPRLRLLTRDWFYADEFPVGRLLCQKAYAPNLARVGGMYMMQWVEVAGKLDSLQGAWFSQEELPALLQHEAACLSEVHFALNFARADIFGLFGSVGLQNIEGIPQFYQALDTLYRQGKSSVFKRVACTRSTDWQIRKPNQNRGYGVGHKDGRFFMMPLMETLRNGERFEMIGLLEEVAQYTQTFCEKVIGWTQLPVRVRRFEDELGKESFDMQFGLVPWNVPGNCGQTVYICPRRSQSNMKQLVTVPSENVWKQYAVHTYATAICGKAESLIFEDETESLLPEVVWFSASDVLRLFYVFPFCDVMTLNNVFHAIAEFPYHLPQENPLS